MSKENESAFAKGPVMRKNHLSLSTSMLCFSLVLGVSLLPTRAQAGFEWVPPGTTVIDQAPQAPAASKAQVPSGSLDSVAPVTIEGTAPLPLAPNVPALAPVGAKSAPARAPEHVLVPPASAQKDMAAQGKELDAKPVKGFANDIPLTVALRQILPSDYGFSMAQDVDAGALVSWRGGAPWRQTLSDMLHVAGLGMQEDGQMIRIVRQGSQPLKKSGGLDSSAALPPATDEGRPVPLAPSSMGVPLDQQYASQHGSVPATVASHTAAALPLDMSGGVSDGAAGQGMIDTWSAERGDTLRKTLEAWSRRANVELVWQAEYDFPLQASVVLSGSFEEAVRHLLTGFQEARPQPVGALHNGAAGGQSVLVIQTLGNNYSG